MIAEAVFQFFDEAQMKQFFLMLADNFPDGEIVFTVMAQSDGFRRWADMFPAAQRDAMKEAWMEAMKEWWAAVPKDQKAKAIRTLKTPTKPKGTEWSDLEGWWNQLSDKEGADAMRDLISSFSPLPSGGDDMWAPKHANEIAEWDSRITVVDQFPLSKNIPQDLLSEDMRKLIDYFDKSGGWNIFHLRV